MIKNSSGFRDLYVGFVNWSSVFIKAVFLSSFSSPNVLEVLSNTLDHVNNGFCFAYHVDEDVYVSCLSRSAKHEIL